jgi:hypothetical protein
MTLQSDPTFEPDRRPRCVLLLLVLLALAVGALALGAVVGLRGGDEAMRWTAASTPSVTLSDSGGELSGGGGNVVSFTVDEDTSRPGRSPSR